MTEAVLDADYGGDEQELEEHASTEAAATISKSPGKSHKALIKANKRKDLDKAKTREEKDTASTDSSDSGWATANFTCTIPPNYDSMIAKLITTAQTREEAIDKMKRALDEFVIEGIKTTIPFHRRLMDSQAYIEGNYTTKFMEDFSMED